MAAKQNRSLETALAPLGVEVEWLEFPFGPPMLEAMRVGSVDFGGVGDTPPTFAQAAHADLLYVAASPSGTAALLLPPGSKLQTLHDLKGKKLAFARGSGAHSLAVAAVEKAGLTWSDIVPVPLAPADAAAAFEHGSIDAWVIWDPYYALYETRPGAGAGHLGRHRRAELLLYRQPRLRDGEPGGHRQDDRYVHNGCRVVAGSP